MRLITAFELASCNVAELRLLFRLASEELAVSEPYSPERRNALASLENIRRALQARRFEP